MVHIKRFRYDSVFSSKLSNMIKFPVSSLELAPYCSAPPPAASRYRCVGLVRHLGGMGGTLSVRLTLLCT